MAPFSSQGADWISQRIGLALNGSLGATIFLFLDYILPRWLKNMYIFYDYITRISTMDKRLVANLHTKSTRVLCFAIPTLCLSVSRIWFVRPGRDILFHHGVVGYALITGIKTLEYLISDATPDERRYDMLAHRDSGVCYFFTAYGWINRWWVWELFCSVALWGLLPLASLCFGIWIPWEYLPERIRKIPLYLAVKLFALFMWTWDFGDKVEAHLMERFPKWMQYKLHRFEQQRRKNRPEYLYLALQPGEIRLLKLKRTPCWFPGSIKAELLHVPMYPTPKYETVSYRWGSSERTESILLDGSPFPVTKSAYDLLIARRSLWRERIIWIDAICINQSDDQEKAAQVQLMRDIYHYAYRVVIFTGGDWTARLAAPLLYETLAATYQIDDSVLGLNKLTNNEKSTTKWKALKELLLNEYFTRAWVVQEIAVGQRVELYYGGLYISWSVFFQLAMHLAHPHRREMLTLGDPKDRSFFGTSSLENIAIMSFLRPDSAAFEENIAERTGLDAVLFTTFTFRAGDPRDKVFAVLGIAKYTDPEGLLLPDYSKSVSQVYRDTGEHLFFHSDRPSIHMLALAGTGSSSESLSTPSWVPNLEQEYLWFPYVDFVGLEGRFRASGDSEAEIHRGEIPGSMSIRGILCDTIVLLGITTVYEGEIRPKGQQDAKYVTRQKHTIIVDIAKSIRKYKDLWPERAGGVDTDLWLSLVAGRINRKRPSADHDWQRVFRHWVGVLEKLLETKDEPPIPIGSDQELPETPSPDIEEGDVVTYDSATEGCYGRRFAISQQGRLCWVPPYAETGDVVFVPFGAQTPFLLRAKGKMDGQDAFELVGESYVQGIMWGELLKSEYQVSTITLI